MKIYQLLVSLILLNVGCNEKAKQNKESKVSVHYKWPIFNRPISVIPICIDSKLSKNYVLRSDTTLIGYGNLSQASAMGARIEMFSTPEHDILFQVDNSGKVRTAEADFIGETKCVIYDENFMRLVDKQSGYNQDDWASISVLAHEIGHHIKEHKKPSPENELQADEHSGWCMRKLGATEEQATSVFSKVFVDDHGDGIHPDSETRIKAILKGYRKADADISQNKKKIVNPYKKCLDSLNVEACKQCADESSVICQRVIRNGNAKINNLSDTCQKIDLYNLLSSSIMKMNSFVEIHDFINAQNEKVKIDKTIKIIKNSPDTISTQCMVKYNGKLWDKCKAIKYQSLAYSSLQTHDLDLAKNYFAISYTSFPWLGTVDEVYNKVLTPDLMKAFRTGDEKSKIKILNQVNNIIAQKEYIVGVPAAYKNDFLISK